MRHVRGALSAALLLSAAPLAAQETQGPTAPSPPIAEPPDAAAAEPPSPQPALLQPVAAPVPQPATGPASDAQASGRGETIKKLETAERDSEAVLSKTGRLKLSGFVQGRYEWHQDSVNGWDYSAKPTSTSPPGNAGSGSKTTFYIRRARLDTNYEGVHSEYVLQIDGAGDSFALKDVEAAFVDTWTPLHLRVSIGQFKYPFGYELPQSEPVREMPERSRMILQLFPGDRDRGLKVEGRYRMVRFQIALVNGNGTQDPIFKAGKDSNAWLDLVGRVGFDLDVIAGGVSWYYGGSDVYNPSYNATTNPDTNPLDLKRYGRVRVGGDVQGYLDVPRLGNLSLRGEIIYSRDKNKAYSGIPADACQDRIGWGWSVVVAQNIGRFIGAVVRVDSYDPLLQSSLDSTLCAGTPDKPGTYVAAGTDRIITYGGGALLYVSPHLKASFIYEHPSEQANKAVDNDIFTAQLQARF